MKDALYFIIILSAINTTFIICFQMWGLFDWWNSRKPKWLKWLKHCFFCYGFRFALYEIVAMAVVYQDWHIFYDLFYIPLACAAITSVFVNTIWHENN